MYTFFYTEILKIEKYYRVGKKCTLTAIAPCQMAAQSLLQIHVYIFPEKDMHSIYAYRKYIYIYIYGGLDPL